MENFVGLWIGANLGIFLGYVFICAKIAPILPFCFRTRVYGVFFFATCGLTHFEMAVHSMMGEYHLLSNSWHGWAIHLVQVMAVWCFVLHLYRDLRRGTCGHGG